MYNCDFKGEWEGLEKGIFKNFAKSELPTQKNNQKINQINQFVKNTQTHKESNQAIMFTFSKF